MKFKIYKHHVLVRTGILALLAFVTMFKMNAQSINTTVASSINNVFSPLEKNRIPHNILLDYGIEFIDINRYDGVLLTDNHTSMSMYKDMYNTLVSSATATGISGMVSPVLEDSEWFTLQKQQNNIYKGTQTAPLVLSGLYYNYSKIRSDALSTNKIQVVNGKYDDKYIGTVWQNPYESKIGFAITVPVQEIHQPTVVVSLPATLWHTNATINNIDVNLGNGNGYKSLNNGTTATETYTSVGMYTWTYRIQLSNGQYKYCQQKVKITVAASGGGQARNSTCSLQPVPIPATRSYLGVFGSAYVQIAYANSDCKLRKPLIVAEGLDTGFFAASGNIGDTDIETFLRSVRTSGSDELRNLITNDTTIDYDVVYVNWDNGTDYLQRNAYVLQAVINYVNQQKAINGSTEPNVVLGQSMGGVIARYALRDMENRSETHNTSLYISHDAPHQGANAPLGFLYMARHAVDQFIRTPLGNIDIPISSGNVGLGSVEDLLDAPGVKQMLINNVNSAFALENNAHDTWQNELKNMGYPQQTRNVALSNASHCASPQDVLAGDRIFTLDAFGKTSFLTDIALSITGLGAVSGILASVVLDEAGFLLGILPGSSKFDIDFWVNAYPVSGTAQIYYGRMKYRKTLLWLIPINVTITERSYNSPSGVLPFDSYPGGVNPSFTGIDVNVFKSGLLGKYGFTVDLNPNFGFIPAVSALDVGGNNTTLNNVDYLTIYTKANPPTGSKAIPFDNFMTSFNTSSINEPHISFNKLNGDWLAEELDADTNTDTFDCAYFCRTNEIIGNNLLCTSSSYTLENIVGNTVTWSASPSSALTFTQGSATTTATKNGGYSGQVTITATVSGGCGSVNVTRNVSVGNYLPIGTSSYNSNCSGNTFNILNTSLSSVCTANTPISFSYKITDSNYSNFVYTPVSVPSGATWSFSGGNLYMTVTTPPSQGSRSATIDLTAIGPCGTYNVNFTSTAVNIYSSFFTISPNPSQGNVTVSMENENLLNDGSQNLIYAIKITDLFGTLGESFEYKAGINSVKIPLQNFNSGLYILSVFDGKIWSSERLIIQK